MGIQINGQNDEIRAVDGSGTVHLDVEGNITGNLTGNANTATTATTADNALGITTTQINVGDTFLKLNSIGIGQTDSTGRNAGVSTAIGTVIYNETDEEVQVYKGDDLGWQNIGSSALKATGGVVNEFSDGSGSYRSHTFFTSGTFEIQTGEKGLNLEFLVVGGGGGGGDNWSPGAGGRGGGGAGGLRSNMSSVPYAMPSNVWQNDGNPASYTVTVGAGGGGNQEQNGYPGNGSSIVGVGNPINIVASGGGGGAHYPSNAGSGGSGGGSAYYASPGREEGATLTSPDSVSPTQQGYRGGRTPDGGGGGGGAGAQGVDGPVSNGGSNGGVGLQVIIAGPDAQFPLGSGGGYFAGGGGGGGGYPSGSVNNGGLGGTGGGGHGSAADTDRSKARDGVTSTGGGGGGAANSSQYSSLPSGPGLGSGGSGGSGVVIISYPT